MKTDAYILRDAGFADALPIFELIRENPDELLARSISDIIQNIDRFLVGEVDGVVAGTISWQILPEIGLAKDPTVEIKSLAVRKAFRSQGLGRRLVETAVERVSNLRPSQVIALTFRPDFFKSLGFTEIPKEDLMHKLYMGCVNCSKYDSPFTCPEVAMGLTLNGGQ